MNYILTIFIFCFWSTAYADSEISEDCFHRLEMGCGNEGCKITRINASTVAVEKKDGTLNILSKNHSVILSQSLSCQKTGSGGFREFTREVNFIAANDPITTERVCFLGRGAEHDVLPRSGAAKVTE